MFDFTIRHQIKDCNLMNENEYCEIVDLQEIELKKLKNTFEIEDDESPLLSLQDAGLNLLYEPSFVKNYQYLIREAIIPKIKRISEKLTEQNMTLAVRSAWRSFDHQSKVWEIHYQKAQKKNPSFTEEQLFNNVNNFVAPAHLSTHSTGGAIDALIFDNKTQKMLDFGTNKNWNIRLSRRCYPYNPKISDVAKQNRKLLLDLFHSEGFICDYKEFWHFDYGNSSWALQKNQEVAFYGSVGELAE